MGLAIALAGISAISVIAGVAFGSIEGSAGKGTAMALIGLLVAPLGPYLIYLSASAFGQPGMWWGLGGVVVVATGLMAYIFELA